MARIPYADVDREETRTLVTEIAAQRGSVLHLYRMLLHSPPIAAGWLHYLTAVRHESTLPGALRELAIMRVALLNRAPYEADQHAPIACAEGLSEAQLDALRTWRSSNDRSAAARRSGLYRRYHPRDTRSRRRVQNHTVAV